jgi:hypothetical protein
MVNHKNEHKAQNARQARGRSSYSQAHENHRLTPYSGLLPVATMLEKL